MISFNDRLVTSDPEGHNDRLHFFKYMSEGTAKIVLKNRTVRWATPDYLNDPFEFQHQVLAKVDNEAVKGRVIDQLWEVFQGRVASAPNSLIAPLLSELKQQRRKLSRKEFDAKFLPSVSASVDNAKWAVGEITGPSIAHFAQTKILSLTVRPDITLMWSHYANSYKGVVLRFRSDPSSVFVMAQPIQYTNVIPAFVTEDFMVRMFAGTVLPPTSPVTQSIIFRKSPEWAYEQEWRLTVGFGRDRSAPYEDLPFGDDELDGVIFGTRTSDADKEKIRRLCAGYPHVKFMQASLLPGATAIEINAII